MQSQRTFGNDAARSRKKDNLQNDLAALELALDSAKGELRKIAGRNREVRMNSRCKAMVCIMCPMLHAVRMSLKQTVGN